MSGIRYLAHSDLANKIIFVIHDCSELLLPFEKMIYWFNKPHSIVGILEQNANLELHLSDLAAFQSVH